MEHKLLYYFVRTRGSLQIARNKKNYHPPLKKGGTKKV